MFRSLASSVISLIVVLLFAFTMIFVWKGSADIKFKRVAMAGDVDTVTVLDQWQEKMNPKLEDVDPGPANDEPMVAEAGPQGGGDKVVIWLSIPGFRGDYIDKADSPFFDMMVSDGADTNKMRPNFPCVTFAAHTTLATGVTPEKHGIPMDVFRDEAGTLHDRPTDTSLIKAEPIWTTATRQDIRTLVHDWPLSQTQTGEHAAAITKAAYNGDETDEQRLNELFEKWSGDTGEKKLRLIMGRLDDVGRAGLVNGPRTDETYAVVTKTDKLISDFVEKVKTNWETLAPAKNAEFALIITTDHGLAELEKNINLPHLLGEDLMANADVIAHDAIGHLYFKDLPENEGEKKIFLDKYDTELRKRTYFRTHLKEELPEAWKYLNEGRVGDRVFVLKSGYAFTDMKSEEPIFDPSAGPNFFGGFGFPVEDSIRMSGQVLMWGYPEPQISGSLDEIDQTKFHATVCKLLGIDPAESANPESLD